MNKNIVICCDGTGNHFNETYSNVVKLFTIAEKDIPAQIAFYDPGVGTISDPMATPFYKGISKLGGLAFGWGLRTNVSEAYTYLCEYYEPGDRIFMFGFSRGAYTVRVLAGLVHTVGLVQKGCQNLFPYAWNIYTKSYKVDVASIALQFKETYSRDVRIHFVGVWDTVTSNGIFNWRKLPFTTNNQSIQNIRHGVAIDERRTYYRQNLFGEVNGQDIKQVWFAGVHSDVGGSYALNESGLSQITLQWMLKEAESFGLKLRAAKRTEILEDGLSNGHSKPNVLEKVHRSLSGFWLVLELFPKWRNRWFPVYIPFGRRRKMYRNMHMVPQLPVVHQSVLDKMSADAEYKPKNLDVSKCHIEPW